MKISQLILISLFLPAVFAHVGYVVPENEFMQNKGSDFAYLLEPLAHLKYIAAMILTPLVLLGGYFVLKKVPFWQKIVSNIRVTSLGYMPLLPWMMRLSLGILFIGSGRAGILVSPLLVGYPQYGFVQLLLGFCLLAGFLLAPATLIAIFLYAIAILKTPYILGNFEIFALAVAFFIMASRKPGVDDLFGIPFPECFPKLEKYIPLILRAGIGIAMIYLALYEKILNPHLAELVVNEFSLTSVVPVSAAMWVLGAGLVECIVGLFLLVGFFTRTTAAIAFIILSLSFFYFQEAVFSHVTLFGVLSMVFVTGGGELSVDHWLKKFANK